MAPSVVGKWMGSGSEIRSGSRFNVEPARTTVGVPVAGDTATIAFPALGPPAVIHTEPPAAHR